MHGVTMKIVFPVFKSIVIISNVSPTGVINHNRRTFEKKTLIAHLLSFEVFVTG